MIGYPDLEGRFGYSPPFAELKKLYKDMPERYQYVEHDGVGHTIITDGEEPLDMRVQVIDWFKRFL